MVGLLPFGARHPILATVEMYWLHCDIGRKSIGNLVLAKQKTPTVG
jgi:hypothetical protein